MDARTQQCEAAFSAFVDHVVKVIALILWRIFLGAKAFEPMAATVSVCPRTC